VAGQIVDQITTSYNALYRGIKRTQPEVTKVSDVPGMPISPPYDRKKQLPSLDSCAVPKKAVLERLGCTSHFGKYRRPERNQLPFDSLLRNVNLLFIFSCCHRQDNICQNSDKVFHYGFVQFTIFLYILFSW